MTGEKVYTEEDLQEYGEELMRQQAQQKDNTHTFFSKIIQHPTTTRIGNVTHEELGEPQLTLRTLKELQVFSKEVENDEVWENYFRQMADVVTDTSLSKEGFLIRMSQTQKQDVSQTEKQEVSAKENKGWFKKKDERRE